MFKGHVSRTMNMPCVSAPPLELTHENRSRLSAPAAALVCLGARVFVVVAQEVSLLLRRPPNELSVSRVSNFPLAD